MNFAASYFSRYKLLPPFHFDEPDNNTNIIVVIPCYDDESVFETLDSLEKANPIQSKIEVIVVVNSGERTPVGIVEKNRKIYNQLLQEAESKLYKNFDLLPVIVEGTVRKKAGVGFARKTGMDEAVRRFAAINKPSGLIVSMDADTLVSPDYFKVIEECFANESAVSFTFQFQHDFNTVKYPEEIIDACKKYETYLRYYRLALKMFNSPFAIHTIGSCFAVRAEAYTKLGGMPIRQGGEDFYFLQKAIKMHPVHEVKDLIVYPSPRISERVPFGTGPSVRAIIETGDYQVYNFNLFLLLKSFYELFPLLEHEDLKNKIPSEILTFIGYNVFDDLLTECRKYSSTSKAFLKRMYDKFDAFFIVKFLNSFTEKGVYPSIDIQNASKTLLSVYGIGFSENIYEEILSLDMQQ